MAKNKPTNKIVNFKRNNLKTPRNKIVPTDDSITTEKSLQRKIDNIEKKIIQNEVKNGICRDLILLSLILGVLEIILPSFLRPTCFTS